MSVVLAAESGSMLVAGIPSSRLVARIGSRRALILCDAVWAPVIALIPVLHFAGALSFPVLVVLAFQAGVPWAAHAGSQSAVVPDLLGEHVERLAQANALLQTLSRLAYFVGPALGGVLLASFGAPAVLLIDAGSFVVSLLLVAAFVPAAECRAEEPAPLALSGGLRFIRRDVRGTFPRDRHGTIACCRFDETRGGTTRSDAARNRRTTCCGGHAGSPTWRR
jgi:MFS family permease